MAMLKTVRVKSIEKVAPAPARNVRGYLVDGRLHDLNRQRLTDLRKRLIHGVSGERVENRSLASRDSDNLFYLWDSQTWVDAMMETKLQYGKIDGRPYYHFIVSPDPADQVSPQACLDLAADWVEECFPNSEWHIDVHDDNANKITHAHVIVNSVYPFDGRKIQRRKTDIIREARVLQRLCSERGLNALPDMTDRFGG